jgi:hypothetical protein
MSQNSDGSDFEDETKAGKRRIGQNDENWSKKKRATTRASTHAKKVGELILIAYAHENYAFPSGKSFRCLSTLF